MERPSKLSAGVSPPAQALFAKRAFARDPRRHNAGVGGSFRLCVSSLQKIVTTALLALGAADGAKADVLELGEQGQVQWRHGAGAVVWTAPSDPVEAPAAPLPPRLATTPPGFAALAAAAAARFGISAALLEAVIWQESRWNPRAVSPKGAQGLGQLMPDTARAMGADPFDPAANLAGAARYLRVQLDRFGGNVELALAAYNAGPERVARLGHVPSIAETRNYVAAITAHLSAATSRNPSR